MFLVMEFGKPKAICTNVVETMKVLSECIKTAEKLLPTIEKMKFEDEFEIACEGISLYTIIKVKVYKIDSLNAAVES